MANNISEIKESINRDQLADSEYKTLKENYGKEEAPNSQHLRISSTQLDPVEYDYLKNQIMQQKSE